MSDEENQIQSLQVEAMWFQTLVMGLLAIGMIAYFIKVGPASFFEKLWKEWKE